MDNKQEMALIKEAEFLVKKTRDLEEKEQYNIRIHWGTDDRGAFEDIDD